MVKQDVTEGWICTFMDAMPFNLEFEITDLRIIEMLPRHCGLEVEMVEAAQKILGIAPPFDYSAVNPRIYTMLEKIRNGEEIEADHWCPAAALGVLWCWQLVHYHKWAWCAVSQHWWETIAVTDPSKRCAIMPIQYFRWITNDTGEIGAKGTTIVSKWPKDYLDDIARGTLPIDPRREFNCICQ